MLCYNKAILSNNLVIGVTVLIKITYQNSLDSFCMHLNKRKYYGKENSQSENSVFKQPRSNKLVQKNRVEVFSYAITIRGAGRIEVE
jgi:hypothetical protein